MDNHGERAIVLVDMDCFYVQVEQKLCPEYNNKPAAVVQYNSWKGGGIIAVNYEARACGVKRGMRGDEAQKHCPELHLFRVPEVRGKADLTRYRDAGASVLAVLCEFCDCVERASVDEAYLDMTSAINKMMSTAPPVTVSQLPNTFVVGCGEEDQDLSDKTDNLESWLQNIYEEDHLFNDRTLVLTAVLVEEMRAAVSEKTGYKCSAGIAHNKMLAKLSCGLHKPNKQTLLPQSAVPLLYNKIQVNKVRNLGGKFGEEVVEKLQAKTMSDLMNYSETQFVSYFGGKTGSWLYKISRGIENEPVIARQLPKSIGCGKNFPGKTALSTRDKVIHWLKQLSIELEERLLKDQAANCRFARSLTVTIRNQSSSGFSILSRSCPIHFYNAERLAADALNALQKLNSAPQSNSEWKPPILSLALSAFKFEDKIDDTSSIQSYFNSKQTTNITDKVTTVEKSNNSKPQVLENTGIAYDTFAKNTDKLKNVTSKTGITSFFKPQIQDSFLKKTDTTTSESTCSKLNSPQFQITQETQQKELVCDLKDIDVNCASNSDINDTQSDAVCNPKNSLIIKSKGFFASKLQDFTSKKENNSSLENNNHITGKQSCLSFDLSFGSAYNDEDVVQSTSHQSIDHESLLDLNDLDSELTKLCDKCHKRIPIWELEEHLDYHVAVELSKEVNKTVIKQTDKGIASGSVSKISSINSKKGASKRKNNLKSTQKSKKHTPVQTNTLDSFIR